MEIFIRFSLEYLYYLIFIYALFMIDPSGWELWGIIEVNYSNSRALLLSDLNSKIPSVLEPDDIQAVVSGTGSNFGTIEHTQIDYKESLNNKEIIAYTSGLGGLFKPGIPIGKIDNNSDGKINFFSDFTQLNYVKIVSYNFGGEK